MGISVILLLVMILNPVQPVYWRITRFQPPISKQFISKSKVKSGVGCIVYCSTYASVLVTKHDGYCYCLTSCPDVNRTGEYIILTSMMTRLSEPSDCVSKGYGIYRELGVCINYISSDKNWLDSERYCNEDGGYLLNVDTEAKLHVSSDIASANGGIQIYVGGSTTFWNASNTKYDWSRGGMVDRFWQKNQPSHSSEEPCVSFRDFTGFNDIACHHKLSFLCELLLL